MYTIRWVARQLGLTPSTVRAWEQRYGVVSPSRTEGGYRLYSDDDLAVLREMARLVADGIQPAQAADQVLSGRGRPTGGEGGPVAEPSGLPGSDALVAASRTYDARALEAALDGAFAAAGFEYVIDVWLVAALSRIGEEWSSGTLDVAQEHFVSAGVMRRLASHFDAAGNARAGHHVVTGLAPGATHEIGTLAFATMLRRAGLQVTYLGPDLPVGSWVEAVRTTRPHAAVVGAPRPEDAPAAAAVVGALSQHADGVRIFVGGAGAPPDRALTGRTLGEASAWLADTIARPGPTVAPGTRTPLG